MIIAPDGLGLFPGSTNTNVDVWGDFNGSGSTLAPSVAETVLANLLPGVTLPDPLNYDQTTAGLFEHFADPYLTPDVRLRLSVLLQLVSVDQIASTIGITDAQAIQTFNLRPILDIIAAGQHSP